MSLVDANPVPTVNDPPAPRDPPTTASTRRTATLVGLLFLTATVAFIVADTLTAGVLAQPDFPTAAHSETTTLATAGVLLFAQFGVVGIAVLLFPLLKRHGESLALAHVGFRVAELAGSLFYLSVPLLAIEAGTGLHDGTIDPSVATSLGAMLHAQYGVAILLIYLPTTAAGMCMAILLYRSRLIPRPLAVLGLISYPALLAGGILDMYDVADVTQGVGLLTLAPGAVFELILPVWLIVRGFAFPHRT